MCETSKAPASRANRLVLLDDALVLDGHLVAGEGHHARAERDVALEERRALQRRFHEPRLYCLARGPETG